MQIGKSECCVRTTSRAVTCPTCWLLGNSLLWDLSSSYYNHQCSGCSSDGMPKLNTFLTLAFCSVRHLKCFSDSAVGEITWFRPPHTIRSCHWINNPHSCTLTALTPDWSRSVILILCCCLSKKISPQKTLLSFCLILNNSFPASFYLLLLVMHRLYRQKKASRLLKQAALVCVAFIFYLLPVRVSHAKQDVSL